MSTANVLQDGLPKIIAGRRVQDMAFAPDQKFGYFICVNKPWNILSSGNVGVDAYTVMFMYTGHFNVADFAYLTVHSTGDEIGLHALPASSRTDNICWWGKTSELNVLPEVVPYEVGYSCFGCKA